MGYSFCLEEHPIFIFKTQAISNKRAPKEFQALIDAGRDKEEFLIK